MVRRISLVKKTGLALMLMAILGAAAPAPANAGLLDFIISILRPHRPSVPVRGGGPVKTPEIDPGMLRGALVLLGGGVLMLTDRRRRS